MRLRIILVAICLLCTSPAFAEDLYYAEAQAGDFSGSSCANAIALSAIQWGDGAGKVSAGDTAHLCGTINIAANTVGLTVGASGTEGNVITIKFEDDAILTSPQFHTNGAIYASAKDYITIDGGTNGIIRNTDNGTGLTYHTASTGVKYSGSYSTIKNLTITDIYHNDGHDSGATDTGGASTWAIQVTSTASGNITIQNNYTEQARAGIVFSYAGNGGVNIDIDSNTTVNHCWHHYITCNDGDAPSIDNFNIHGNDISSWYDWGYPAATYHQDGIMISGNGVADETPLNVYGNKIHGNLAGGSVTASIYCTYGASSYPGPRVNIYNNLIVAEDGGNMTGPSLAGGNTYNIYNNTIILNPNKTNAGIMGGGGVSNFSTLNIVGNLVMYAVQGVMSPSSVNYHLGTVDYNLWYEITKWSDVENLVYRLTFEAWQGAGYDVNGYYENPNLTASYHLQSTSGNAKEGGADLSGTFTTDYAGDTRTVPWSIGAYEYRTVPNISNFGTGAITITPNNAGAIAVTPY